MFPKIWPMMFVVLLHISYPFMYKISIGIFPDFCKFFKSHKPHISNCAALKPYSNHFFTIYIAYFELCVYCLYVKYNYVKFRIDFFNHKIHLAHADIIHKNNIMFSGIILTIVHSMALGYSAMIILIGTRPI